MPFQKLQNGVKAAQFRVKFKDIFSMKLLYTDLRYWLKDNGWFSVDCDEKIESGKDHWETMYLERGLPDGAVERWVFWRTQKMPVANSYYKWHLDIDFHNVKLTETEVMREGKKFKVNKGEVEVKVWAFLEFDYQGQWSNHPILKFFNKMFPNRIFKKEMYEDHKKELYREAYNLQNHLKRWMKIRRFLPYEEITPFHPSRAYPKWKKE